VNCLSASYSDLQNKVRPGNWLITLKTIVTLLHFAVLLGLSRLDFLAYDPVVAQPSVLVIGWTLLFRQARQATTFSLRGMR